jgi:hypothetical protein
MKFCRNGPACGICQYVDHIVISGERFCPDDIFECARQRGNSKKDPPLELGLGLK